MANNNYPQITSVTSETLQAQIRSLLPSQEGFGTDLMAQNVIVPVIDLTSAAEGSTVPEYLQTSLAFRSQTTIDVTNTTTTIANTPGFYQLLAIASIDDNAAGANVEVQLGDGATQKVVWRFRNYGSGGNPVRIHQQVELTVFLRAGDTLDVVSTSVNTTFQGSIRQVADVNGVLVNPSGFSPQ